jgi:hypothetical protein
LAAPVDPSQTGDDEQDGTRDQHAQKRRQMANGQREQERKIVQQKRGGRLQRE